MESILGEKLSQKIEDIKPAWIVSDEEEEKLITYQSYPGRI